MFWSFNQKISRLTNDTRWSKREEWSLVSLVVKTYRFQKKYEESLVGPRRVVIWQGMIDTGPRPLGALMYDGTANSSADRNHRSKVHTSFKCWLKLEMFSEGEINPNGFFMHSDHVVWTPNSFRNHSADLTWEDYLGLLQRKHLMGKFTVTHNPNCANIINILEELF